MAFEFIDKTGIIVPDTSDILNEVKAEWTGAFGEDLSTEPETPQGVLIVSETIARKSVAEISAEVANQVNPNYATGPFLDAICALSGLTRLNATRSTIASVSLTGIPGTVIPSGRRARDASGNLWATASNVTISPLGTANVDFVCTEYGNIFCSVGDLNTIEDFVLGWEAVYNSNQSVVGRSRQSDTSLRLQRNETLALQGISINEAIISGLKNIPGVHSLSYRENYTGSPQTIDGIYLVEHSIWACVNGGEADDIGLVLLNEKTAGSAYNGSTIVYVLDEFSGQTYEVKFDRPNQKPVEFIVTVSAGSYTGDIDSAVKDAVLSYAAGDIDGNPGFVVGGDVSPFEIAAGVNELLSGIFVRDVQCQFVGGTGFGRMTLPIALNEIATVIESAITVVVV